MIKYHYDKHLLNILKFLKNIPNNKTIVVQFVYTNIHTQRSKLIFRLEMCRYNFYRKTKFMLP